MSPWMDEGPAAPVCWIGARCRPAGGGAEHPLSPQPPSPRRSGGRGRRAVEDGGPYLGYDLVEPVHDLVVLESDHAVAVGFQEPGPVTVALRLRVMDRAVDLDDEAKLRTTEVQNECAQRVLPPEPGSLDLPSSNRLPEPLLCHGRRLPMRPRRLSQFARDPAISFLHVLIFRFRIRPSQPAAALPLPPERRGEGSWGVR